MASSNRKDVVAWQRSPLNIALASFNEPHIPAIVNFLYHFYITFHEEYATRVN